MMNEESKSGVAEFRKGQRVSGTIRKNSPYLNRQGESVAGELLYVNLRPFIRVHDDERNHDYDYDVEPSSLRHEPAEEQKACASPTVGEFRYGITVEDSEHGEGVAVQGWVRSVGSLKKDDVVLEFRDKDDTIAIVRGDSLSTTPHSSSKKPSEPVRGDPYLAHLVKLAGDVALGMQDTETVESMVAIWQTQDDEERLSAMTLRERRKSEALRMLDRPFPVRSGALLDRDKYGQRVALHGWSEDAEYEVQV